MNVNENNTPPVGQLGFQDLLQLYSFFANLPPEIRNELNNQQNLTKLSTIITSVITTFESTRVPHHGH